MTRAQQPDRRPWTEEEDKTVRALVGLMSFSKLAAHLGTGRTRNAVIGHANRLGISKAKVPQRYTDRPKQSNPVPPPSQRKPSLPALVRLSVPPKPAPIILVAPPIEGRVVFADLKRGMCKWPISDPSRADFCFCGAPEGERKPYCDFHANVAYTGSVRRSERPQTGYLKLTHMEGKAK